MEDFDFRDDDSLGKEQEFERALRPKSFGDFSGQQQVLENLQVFVQAAKNRGEALDHVLLHGPPDWVKPLWPILSPMKWG